MALGAILRALASAASRTMADIRAIPRGVSAAVRSVGSTLGRTAAQAAAHAAMGPVTREGEYRANRVGQNLLPDQSSLIHAHYVGEITFGEVQLGLAYLGIPYEPGTAESEWNFTHTIWQRVIEAGRPTLDIGAAYDLYHVGILSNEDFSRILLRHGIRHPNDITTLKASPHFVSLDTAGYLLNAGDINEPLFRELCDRNGLTRTDQQDLIIGLRTPIDLDEVRRRYWLGVATEVDTDYELGRLGYGRTGDRDRVIGAYAPLLPGDAWLLRNRGVITPERATRHYQAGGYISERAREELEQSLLPTPTVTDLTLWSVREGWDEEIVARFGHDLDRPVQYDAYALMFGWAWAQPYTDAVGVVRPGVPWHILSWRSHWQPMPLGSAYDALHRLRPGRESRYQGVSPGMQPFQPRDLELILRQADYPAGIRPWLAALSSQTMRLFDIRQSFLTRVQNRQWAIDQLRDRGYVVEDATATVNLWERQRELKEQAIQIRLLSSYTLRYYKEVLAGYADGLVPRATVYERLGGLFFTRAEIDSMLDVEESKILRDAVKAFVKQVRSHFLDGTISAPEAVAQLTRAQIAPEHAQRYLVQWGNLFTLRRRSLTTARILALMRDGIMSPDAAAMRLRNLGWVEGDIVVQIAAVNRSISLQRQKAAQVEGRARVAQRKLIAAAAQKAGALQRQARAQLRTLYPLSDLRAWLKKGIVTEQYARDRLREQGRPADYIDQFIEATSGPKTNGKAATGPSAQAPPTTP